MRRDCGVWTVLGLMWGFVLGGVDSGERLEAGEIGRGFLGMVDFSDWERTRPSAPSDPEVWQSPVLQTPEAFNQLVVSWNYQGSLQGALVVEVSVLAGDTWSEFYDLGHWRAGPRVEERTSVNDQVDAIGRVSTDTLLLQVPVTQFRMRLSDSRGELTLGDLSLLGCSWVHSELPPVPARENRSAWGVELAVPQRCQLDYEGGNVWCSPTSVSMVLAHWATVLGRDEMVWTVPDLAAAVFDPGWNGTGNWPFNTAVAGSYPGMRGYVVRLLEVSDLEAFVAQGIPVTVSVAYSVLKGTPSRRNDGHLIVCVGFTEDGDIIVNDPAKKGVVRWAYDRERFIAAWQRSRNTAYLIYPESAALPPDPAGLWSVD